MADRTTATPKKRHKPEEIARALGVDVLWFMAIYNVEAAFLLMASPGKIEMAVQLF